MAERLPGKTLGDFKIEELIGRGAMARVFRATQLSLNRPVALKVLEEGIFTIDELRERFLREAQSIARLEHPHIVPIYGAGQKDNLHYYAMRYVQGRNLEQELQQGLPLAQGIRYLAEIAGALGYAHDRGLIHRDVKPANIMIADRVAVLADFGLARLLDASTITATGQLIGTPLYFSPEQARRERATGLSDLFSLGIVLYEVATGQHPFGPLSAGLEDLLKRITTAPVAPPTQVRPGIPRRLEEIICRALQKNPADRQASGHVLRQELLEAAAECPADLAAGSSRASATAVIERESPARTFGKYLLHEVLGERPSSRVYRATRSGSDRRFAMKIFEGKVDRERFTKQFAPVSRLRHPNLVAVHESGEEEGKAYLVMDYVEGTSLEKVAGGGLLPTRTSLEIVRDIGRALQYAHEQGVVHGRLEPARILVSGAGRAFVAGFGLEGNAPTDDPLVDVRAMGAVLYRLLTGRPLGDELVLPRAVQPRLHQDVETICLTAIESKGRSGYPSAGELAADLDRFLAGEGISAKPSGAVRKLWRKLRPPPSL